MRDIVDEEGNEVVREVVWRVVVRGVGEDGRDRVCMVERREEVV